MTGIKAILCDVGSVLMEFDAKTRDENLAQLFKTTRETIAVFWDGPAPDGGIPLFKRFCMGTVLPHELRKALCDQFGVEVSEPDFWKVWLCGFKRPIQETIDLVRRVKERNGVKVVACTDVDVMWCERMRGPDEPLHGLFVAEAQSCFIGVVKPDPAMYTTALNFAGVKPWEAVMIDDIAANVEGAQALGIHAVLYEDPAKLKLDLKPYSLRV